MSIAQIASDPPKNSNNVDEVFLYQAAVENRDGLYASEADLAMVGQDVEDWRELPDSQQEEDIELPELPPHLIRLEVKVFRSQASGCSCSCSREEEGQ